MLSVVQESSFGAVPCAYAVVQVSCCGALPRGRDAVCGADATGDVRWGKKNKICRQ